MSTFAIQPTIQFGWETFKKRSWFFAGVALLIVVLNGIAQIIGGLFGVDEVASGIGSLVNFILGTFISMGVTAFYLKAHDAPEHVESTELWHPQPFWSYFFAQILVVLVFVLGCILLIVPGIIFALMFMFTPYIIIEKGMGPIEAMKESARITSGHKWELLGLSLLLGLINLLGLLCLVIGLFVTVPLSSLAIVHAYRTLSHNHHHAA